MKSKSIICSGALVYARSTKRFLLLYRTQGRAKDVWGLVGGTNEEAETPWEGLRREIFEEIGELDSAISSFNLSIEINPNFPWSYKKLGDILEEKGELDATVKYYKKFILYLYFPKYLVLEV